MGVAELSLILAFREICLSCSPLSLLTGSFTYIYLQMYLCTVFLYAIYLRRFPLLGILKGFVWQLPGDGYRGWWMNFTSFIFLPFSVLHSRKKSELLNPVIVLSTRHASHGDYPANAWCSESEPVSSIELSSMGLSLYNIYRCFQGKIEKNQWIQTAVIQAMISKRRLASLIALQSCCCYAFNENKPKFLNHFYNALLDYIWEKVFLFKNQDVVTPIMLSVVPTNQPWCVLYPPVKSKVVGTTKWALWKCISFFLSTGFTEHFCKLSNVSNSLKNSTGSTLVLT